MVTRLAGGQRVRPETLGLANHDATTPEFTIRYDQSHRRQLEELDGKWNRGDSNRDIAGAEFHRKTSKKNAG